MARCYLSVLLLLLCAACATPQDLVKVPGLEPEQACALLEEAGYDPGGCWSIMDTDQMRRAVALFQEHQRLKPADGNLNRETWARLNTVVRAMRKLKAARAAPPKANTAAKPSSAGPAKGQPAKAKAPAAKPKAMPPPPPLPLEAGAKVFAVERAKCLPRSGAWVLAYVGVVQSLEGDKAAVTLQGRISYRFNPGEEGVDDKDWFCVPRRRHCYSSVPFGDWGGVRRSGETTAFDKTKVRRIGADPKDALYDLARQVCR